MRILSISAQKPDSTGSGIYLAETARGFRENGHEVMIVAGVDASDDPELPEGVAFDAVRFNRPGLPFPVCGMSDQMPYEATRYRDMTPEMVEAFRREFSRVITRAIDSFGPDLIICHHLYLLVSVVFELRPPCPVCAVCHSTDLRQMRSHELERERIIRAVRSLDLIFALHEAQKEEIVTIYGVDPARVVVVGTGFNQRMFHGGADAADAARMEAMGLANAPIRIAYAGKIWRKKGVASLIASLSLLAHSADSIELDLAGGYNSREEYEALKGLARTASVKTRFLGKLPQEDLASLYRSSDVFVLPSFFEGLPLVVVEALACGCVVVVTDLPGIRPWLEESLPNAPVIYVEPPRIVNVDVPVEEDLPAFEERLASALDEAIEKAQSRKGSMVDCRHLSWAGLAEKMISFSYETRVQRCATASGVRWRPEAV